MSCITANVRVLTSLALARLAREPNGREQMLKHDSIKVLQRLVKDSERP